MSTLDPEIGRKSPLESPSPTGSLHEFRTSLAFLVKRIPDRSYCLINCAHGGILR